MPPEVPALVAELLERFALADRHGAVARARTLLRDGVPERDLREVVSRAVRHVGDLWQSGQWTVAQEHAATAVAEAVLTTLEHLGAEVEPCGAVAVTAADGEWHAMPGRLAAHAFERAGLTVRYLGAGIPADDVARTLPTTGADVLAVSVTMVGNLAGAARTVAAGRAAGLPVVLGGAASTPERAAALGADAHAPDVEAGAAIARRWCEEGAPDPVSPTLDTAAVDQLQLVRDRLRDEAFAAACERWPDLESAPGPVIDRVVEDLDLHLDHLVAAVLLDDPSAYLDFVPWLAAVHAGRQLPTVAIEAQLAGLEVTLEAHDAARDLVERARDTVHQHG